MKFFSFGGLLLSKHLRQILPSNFLGSKVSVLLRLVLKLYGVVEKKREKKEERAEEGDLG